MAMSELGAYLERHRTERGLTLDEVEDLTRIRRVYLEAMESGEWDALPPGVYTRGLLKNYARALGVSQASVLRLYVKERPNEARMPEPQLISRPLVNEPRVSLEMMMALVIMVAAVGLMAWIVQGYVLPAIQQAGATPTAPPVSATPRPVPSPAATLQPAATTGAAAGVPVTSTLGTPGTPGTPGAPPADGGGTAAPGTPGTPPPGAPTSPLRSTAAPLATATGGATPAAAATGGLGVEVRANGNAWLRIVLDGEEAFEGFLRQGDAWKGQAKAEALIRMGNAGDTQIILNGRRLDPLGKRGEVLTRAWRLLPDGNIEQIDRPD